MVGLAAAGLTHQRQRFAGVDVEAHFLDGMHAVRDPAKEVVAHVEARGQFFHAQHRFVVARRVLFARFAHFAQSVAFQHGLRRAQRQVAARQAAQARHRRQQRAGVRMLGRVEDLIHRALLDLLAAQHHHHVVGHFRHHAHVVGDEDHGRAQVALQFADGVQDLRLDGDVQRGGRLIGDQQARLARQRHRDHHALAHAARQLVRIAVQHLFGVGQAHFLQQLAGRLARARARQLLVQHDGLDDLVADGEHRVQRGHRLLEDHRDVVAADGAHVFIRRRGQVDLARSAPSRNRIWPVAMRPLV
jgi:hypothetical protein